MKGGNVVAKKSVGGSEKRRKTNGGNAGGKAVYRHRRNIRTAKRGAASGNEELSENVASAKIIIKHGAHRIAPHARIMRAWR